jgi:hypothetical protein
MAVELRLPCPEHLVSLSFATTPTFPLQMDSPTNQRLILSPRLETNTSPVWRRPVQHDECIPYSPRGPGTTLHSIYLSWGHFAAAHANRLAHKLGLGPLAVTLRIQGFFGDGFDREVKLDTLKCAAEVQKLQRDCLRLMRYNLPCAPKFITPYIY